MDNMRMRDNMSHGVTFAFSRRLRINDGCRIPADPIDWKESPEFAPVAQLDRASGYEPEGRVFESPRAHHLNDPHSNGCGRYLHAGQIGSLGGMPRSMPTVCHLRPIHRRANRLLLRVNVALGNVHVAMPCEVCQGPWVHVRCPPSEA